MKETSTGETLAEPDIVTGDVMLGELLLTEAELTQAAIDAELITVDVEQLRGRVRMGRPTIGDGPAGVLQVRFDDALRSRLAEAAEAEHTTPSAIVREAVQAWLNDRPHAVGE